RVNREREPAPPQPPRGAKQIVIPMTRPLYDEIWHDPRRIRALVDGWARSAPELFPAGFDRGYRLHGFGRESRKLPGLKLRKGYVATTVGGGCLLGVALTSAADDAHLREAYGVFAAEARDVEPGYAPETVNVDGWAATRNAFSSLFTTVTVVLCFLHGFLKV